MNRWPPRSLASRSSLPPGGGVAPAVRQSRSRGPCLKEAEAFIQRLPGWLRSGLPLALAITCLTTHAQDPIPQSQIQRAVAHVDALAASLMQRTGIPGMAVAVVQGDRTVYAKGFGVRVAGQPQPVDADTVFQIASMSKPIGATVMAHQVGLGRITWDTPVRKYLPAFSVGNAYVSEYLSVGDLYAHRSGLPDHAGDTLEELGYPQAEIFRRMPQLPLGSFRDSYAYTNYGMTAAAMSVAAAAGTDWATLSEQVLYRPLGMASTSSRFADFKARPNRAFGHVKENGVFVVGPERGTTPGGQRWAAYDTDPQSPSGGVSSSANDIARWMSFLLATGKGPRGELLAPAALLAAMTPRTITYQAQKPGEQSVFYGYGFAVATTPAGRTVLSHNGAFSWGASTNFSVIPSANVGIVVLTNAWPVGAAEAIVGEFNDVLQFGAPQKDWFGIYGGAMAGAFTPQGEFAGKARPAQPAPPQPPGAYVGLYANDYHGRAEVAVTAGGGLELRIGHALQHVFALQHWDGDTFTFVPLNDAAPPGSLSKASFSGGRLTLEHYNHQGLGVFTRNAAAR